MTKYKILLFTPVFLPEANPEAFVNANLAYALIKDGHHVDIITRHTDKQNHFSFNALKDNRWNKLQQNTHSILYKSNKGILEYFKNIHACITSRTILKGNKIWKQEFEKGKELHLKNNYDFILARAMPVVGLLAGYKLAKKFNIPLLININDPTVTSPPPYPNYKNWTFFFINNFIKKVFNQAKVISYPSKYLMNYELTFHSITPNNKFHIIPHISNIEHKKYMSKNDTKEFTITHAGTLGDIRNPIYFLKAFSLLQKKFPDVKMNLKLLGVISNKWKNKISEFKNIQFLGNVTQNDANKILSQSSVQLIIEACCDKGIFFPSKFVDYIQNERPILAVSPVDSTLNYLIKKYPVGRLGNCNNSSDILHKLEFFYLVWQNNKTEQTFNFDIAKNAFSKDIVNYYNHLFDTIKKA